MDWSRIYEDSGLSVAYIVEGSGGYTRHWVGPFGRDNRVLIWREGAFTAQRTPARKATRNRIAGTIEACGATYNAE